MYNNIIVSGGTRGLGKSIVLELSLIFHSVVTMGRSKDKELSKNPYIYTYPCDITDNKQVKEFMGEAFNYMNADVLINNAGLIRFDNIEDIKEEDLDEVIDVNLKGSIRVTREFLKRKPKNRPAMIINIGSTRAISGAPNKAVYSASKFGLRALTQTINEEYENVKATIICPGTIDTKSTRENNRTNNKMVEEMDIIKTINYLLSLSQYANVPEIIIGGQI